MIKIQDISKQFTIKNNIVKALSNINLEILERDCFAIVGESGSGKTTLANIILGIYQQDEGEVLFENKILIKNRSLQLRKLIQFVQQNPMSTLNPKKTIYSTIALPLKIHKIVENNKYKEKVEELLSFVGLENNFMDRYPDTLSGGQKQRVAIARALAPKPKTVLLDEPFSSLDTDLRRDLRKDTRDLFKETNTSSIIVTHELEEAKVFCDRIYKLENTNIREIF